MANKEASLLLKVKTAGEEALSKVSDGLKKIGEIGTVAFGAIVAIGTKAIAAYSEQEAATNSLTRAMVTSGTYSKSLRDAYLDQASALQKVTTFGDEAITQAQATFIQQSKGIQLTKEQTLAILDFAQANKMDLNSAFSLVGRSVGTNLNALSRYGVEVNTTASSSEKLSQIMNGLNSKFGGQATAAAQGLGVIKQLENAYGDLFEVLGEKLAPTINVVAKSLLNMATTDGGIVTNFIDGIASSFNYIIKVGTSLTGVFQMVGTSIGGTLGTLAGALEQLAQGNFRNAKNALVDGFKSLGDENIRIVEETNQRLIDLDNARLKSQRQNQEREKQDLIQSLDNKRIVQEEAALKDRELELQRMIEDNQIKSEMELALLDGRKSAIYAAEVAAADKRYKAATTQAEKTKALEDKARASDLLATAKYNESNEQMQKDTLSKISSLSQSNNKSLAAIGKAAAITQIAIETPVAVAKAYSAFPPPFNFAAAGLVAAAMASQAAQIAGVPLAEGGIVLPRPGGTQATIGEAGKAEAVIPLDRAGEFGLGGGGTTIQLNVYGGMLGSESEAREFAVAIDKELFKLRRNNESVAFDSGVI